MNNITATVTQPKIEATITMPVIAVTLQGMTVINTGAVYLPGFTAENTSGVTIEKGQPITGKIDGSIELAVNSGTKDCIGIASEQILTAHSGKIIDDDVLELSDWILISGANNLTPKQIYYLSDTAGMITNTVPISGYVQIIGISITSTKLQININESIKL